MNLGEIIALAFAATCVYIVLDALFTPRDSSARRIEYDPSAESNEYWTAVIPEPEPQSGQGWPRLHLDTGRTDAQKCADNAIARATWKMRG